MIRGLFNKDQDVIFLDAIIEPLKKTVAYKGCKITAQKKLVFFCKFCLTSLIFLALVLLSSSSRDALSPVCGIFLDKEQ